MAHQSQTPPVPAADEFSQNPTFRKSPQNVTKQQTENQMRARLTILGHGLFVAILALVCAQGAVGQDQILYATDRQNSIIYAVDVSKSPGNNTVVTNTGLPTLSLDSLIFDHDGNVLYDVQFTDATHPSKLVRYNVNTKTSTVLVSSGLGNTPADLALEPSLTSVLISDALGGRILRYDVGG